MTHSEYSAKLPYTTDAMSIMTIDTGPGRAEGGRLRRFIYSIKGTYRAMVSPLSRAALNRKPRPVTAKRSKNQVLTVPATIKSTAKGMYNLA